jgi:uncharacterized membrane protein
MEVVLFYVAVCLFVGWMASGTTLGFGNAFLLSLILTPITGFIVMLFYPSKRHRDAQTQSLERIASSIESGISSADELKKLKDLFDSGALSEDEYNRAKAKVIG